MKTNKAQSFTLNKDQSFVITFTVSQSDIDARYQQLLHQAASTINIKGFRQGKAPLNLVMPHLSEEKLMSETFNNVVSHAYGHQLEEHHLRPIMPPQVKLLNPPLALGKSWQVEITACQLPPIKLGNYQEGILKLKKPATSDQILELITKLTTVNLPPVLIQSEVTNRLSQLIDQTAQAGITVNQYLQSKGTTLEQYQSSLKTQLIREWTINLALDHIALDQKIEIKPEEVKAAAAKYPDQKVDLSLLTYLLRQQKTLAWLQAIK